MSNTVEMVTFRLVDGVTPAKFVANNDSVNAWLRRQPGFESRQLSLREDGTWVDIVRWRSPEGAKNAADKIMVELGDCACMAMVDPASIVMSHSQVQLSA